MSATALPRLACTIGDSNGIGLEVLIKSLAEEDIRKVCSPLIIGNRRIISDYTSAIPSLEAHVQDEMLIVKAHPFPIIDIHSDVHLAFGTMTANAGKLAGNAIVKAVQMIENNEADAIVTMPISKAGLHAGGYDYPGHTEMLASLTDQSVPLMILLTEGMRVALVTIHIPVSQVSPSLSKEKITARVIQLYTSLRKDFGISNPRIAVLGLNPHAGEDGAIGDEEQRLIRPVIEQLTKKNGYDLHGPFPADGFFAHYEADRYDAILAMYHDQGLIPLKMFAHGYGVNFTAGLPIVRTSPDHGVAYPIAGQGSASCTSTISAIKIAVETISHRATFTTQPSAFL